MEITKGTCVFILFTLEASYGCYLLETLGIIILNIFIQKYQNYSDDKFSTSDSSFNILYFSMQNNSLLDFVAV